MAFIHKRREADRHNESAAKAVIGEVKGRHTVIIDDIIDTAGTVCNAAELLMEKGALSVTVAATHGILSDPAVDRIKNAPIRELITSNSLPLRPNALELEQIKVLSIAPIVAEALEAIFMESSVSQIFLGENV